MLAFTIYTWHHIVNVIQYIFLSLKFSMEYKLTGLSMTAISSTIIINVQYSRLSTTPSNNIETLQTLRCMCVVYMQNKCIKPQTKRGRYIYYIFYFSWTSAYTFVLRNNICNNFMTTTELIKKKKFLSDHKI